MKSMYYWLGKHVHAPYGIYVFSLLIFLEGLFVVPVSALLAFFCLENRHRTFFYAALATIMSALGALALYHLGLLLWKSTGTTFITYFVTQSKFDYLVEQYNNYQGWAVFIAALAPLPIVPFKLVALTAGFCKLSLTKFILFAFVARGIKFYFIATTIYIWAEQVQYYLNKYFYYFMIAGIGLFICIWWLLHY